MRQLFANRQYTNPGIVPWVFVVLSIAVLFSLGIWQMQRLVWKENLLTKIEIGQQLVPLIELPTNQQAFEDALYRKVKITADVNRQTYFLKVGVKQIEGKGYYVLTPLTLGYNDGTTAHILINRGFIAGDKEAIEKALNNETAKGPTIIEGILRPAHLPRLFTPKSHPDKNIWTSEDVANMQVEVDKLYSGVDASLLPYVIEVTSEQPFKGEAAPKPSNAKIRYRNDHLGYAVTWFGLALTGIVMFYFYCFRRKEEVIK